MPMTRAFVVSTSLPERQVLFLLEGLSLADDFGDEFSIVITYVFDCVISQCSPFVYAMNFKEVNE